MFKDSVLLTVGAVIAVLSLSLGAYLSWNVGFSAGYVKGRWERKPQKVEASTVPQLNPFGDSLTIEEINKIPIGSVQPK